MGEAFLQCCTDLWVSDEEVVSSRPIFYLHLLLLVSLESWTFSQGLVANNIYVSSWNSVMEKSEGKKITQINTFTFSISFKGLHPLYLKKKNVISIMDGKK